MNEFNCADARWTAVQTRNPLASNSFIYSVITTKIYCRPTCPSRCARRANVVFHENAAAAEADGFRACKRCRPDVLEGDGEGEGEKQRKIIEKACVLLENELIQGKKWAIKNLAAEVGFTESHFCRVFKKVTGMTVGDYRTKLLLAAQGIANIATLNTLENGHGNFEISSTTNFNESRSTDNNLLPWDCLDSEKLPNTGFFEPDLYNFDTSGIDLHEALENLTTPYPSTAHNVYLDDDGLQFFDFALLSQNQLSEKS